jgi:hypothetical protein
MNRYRRQVTVTPIWLAGWALTALAGIFFAYVLLRSWQLGVVDGVVGATLAVSAGVCFVGLGLVRISGPVRERLLRGTPANASVEEAGSPVSIEAYRRQGALGDPTARLTCRACGAEYAVEGSAGVCPECGRGSVAV